MSFTTGDFSDLALYQGAATTRPSALKWTGIASIVIGAGGLATLCAIGALTTAGVVSVSLGANHSLSSFQPDSSVAEVRQPPYGTLASSAKFFAARSSATYRAPAGLDLRGTIQAGDEFQTAQAAAADQNGPGVPNSVRPGAANPPSPPLPPVRIQLPNPPLPPVRDAMAAVAARLDAAKIVADAAVGAGLPDSPPLPPVRAEAPRERVASLEPAVPSPPLVAPVREIPAETEAPLPPSRPVARPQAAEVPTAMPPRLAPGRATAPGAPPAASDNRNIFQRFFASLHQPSEPPGGSFAAPLPSDFASLAADGRTAVYDISAHTVFLPNGERLEAHSGLGALIDDPTHVNAKDRGATPPHLYDLALRGQLFHGVQALRLNPVGQGAMYGRVGLLAHTYMLGPRGDSNGCVSFKEYPKFLQAYKSGQIQRLAVVGRLSGDPAPAFASRGSRRRDGRA